MQTTKVNLFDGDKNTACLGDNQNWWFDLSFPHSYSIFDLDGFYPENYFKHDHVTQEVVQNYVNYILEYGRQILGRDVRSVLELGCGGGWFTEEFLRRGLEIVPVEGTHAGYDHALKRGVPESILIRHDLRKPLNLNRTFDIVVCTEVAEHIECPFSSQLVQNIINHGSLAWFSFEEPATNDATYDHCNERPEKFWVNLFKFYGRFPMRLPEEVTRACDSRGDLVFYSDDIVLPADMKREAEDSSGVSEICLGAKPNGEKWGRVKATMKQFVPPIVWNAFRRLRRPR